MPVTTEPRDAAQHERPTLDIWNGPMGFRVGFVGGATREIIADNLTYEQAAAMFYAARVAVHGLKTSLAHGRVS